MTHTHTLIRNPQLDAKKRPLFDKTFSLAGHYGIVQMTLKLVKFGAYKDIMCKVRLGDVW